MSLTSSPDKLEIQDILRALQNWNEPLGNRADALPCGRKDL